ncbi:caspase family protein [Streptomyces canus]|uniref:caspase family protein n=1 Tax=Streptomyces canus TaxID=58343 RepID=UPI002E35EA93|nr:caspase family protein [Streptomyces canus]
MTREAGAGYDAVGRRFLIAAGVGTFRDPGIDRLPGVDRDVQRVRELLEPMGYECVLPALARDPSRAALAEGIEDWALETDLGPEDVVVVYFAGHGVHEEDRHYLLCADTRRGRWTRALAAEDLARPLVKSAVGHLLVMLDTCFAAAGTADISRLAGDLANLHRGRANRWHLAAARSKDWARENVFVDALTDVFAHLRHGATQQYVSVREVTERVNEYLRIHRPVQQARLTIPETDGMDPFFPSPLFEPGLPADGIDLASLALLRRRQAGHFGPRGRGLEHAGERGDYFTGRTRALQELTAFLIAPGASYDRKARVVTGDPGSGKSALLGRLLALTDPDSPKTETGLRAKQSAALPPVIALHARRAALEDLTADLAAALHLPAPVSVHTVLAALAARTTAVAIVLDSLDEAGTAGDTHEAARIARELLQPLSTLPWVRLIVGTRRPQIPSLGHAVHILDLDDSGYITEREIAAYARALLENAQDPDSRSPYRHRPDLAAVIADGIAARAGSSYLVARMTARALVHGQIDIDTTKPGWRERLPSDAKEAFAAYLDRFGPARSKIERLLRPLAYAQGAGLPWSTLWAPLAEDLSGLPCPQDDLDWLHRHAGAYIVETPTSNGSAYRLFHETMAEYLRRAGREHADHATIAHTLTSLVRTDEATGVNDWPAAHPYIRHHLATHAASGRTLPTLLDDPEYLVHARPATLLRALGTLASPVQPIAADIYRASAAVHSGLSPTARRDVLALDAARYHQNDLAVRLARTRPWTPRWATGNLVHPALRATLTGHTDKVNAVAVTEIEGRPHAVTGGFDWPVRVWDLTTGTERATLRGHTRMVRAVVVAEIYGRLYALTASDDRTVRVWDLTTGTERATLRGHASWVNAVAVTQIGGHPHALTADGFGTVRVWDLTTGTERAIYTDHTGAVNAVAVTEIGGHPHALTASDDMTVRVWDLTTGTERATLRGHTGPVNDVTVTQIDGHPHALTADGNGTVRVWDLTTGTERATLTERASAVKAVTVMEIGGHPHALTAHGNGTVRVWDLTTGTERATLTGHADSVNDVTVTEIEGRPHAVTASDDRTVRVWDLTTGTERATPTGHTSAVKAVTVMEFDGRPDAVTSDGSGTVRMWNLSTGTERATYTGWVRAVAVTEIDGHPHALTASYDRRVLMWDLATGTVRATYTGTGSVEVMAVTEIDGRPHALAASEDMTVLVWDLATGTVRATFSGTGSVNVMAVTEIDGHPHALTAGYDRTVLVWDLATGTVRATLSGHTHMVNAVAVTEIDGHPHALTADEDGTVLVWDLATGTERATYTGHTGSVRAVAVMELDGRPHALTAGDDRTVQVWDLSASRAVAVLSLPLPGQAIATYGHCIVLGMVNEVVVLQRHGDGQQGGTTATA